MPKQITIAVDPKLAAMLKGWHKIEAVLKDPTLRGPKPWTKMEEASTATWLYGTALETIGSHLARIYDEQYPKDKFVR